MEKEFIPYDLALRMKQLGFDEPCFGYYNYNGTYLFDYKPKTDDKNLTKAPLYQQAFRWFREKHGLNHSIMKSGYIVNSTIDEKFAAAEGFNLKTYDEKEYACLNIIIKIIELNTNQDDKRRITKSTRALHKR
jgi:hypothetical protein